MMSENKLIEKWSRAHSSFNKVENVLSSNKSRNGGLYEIAFQKALHNSPNGQLYYHSAFLKDLANNKKLFLGHITFQLDEIIKSKHLYSSGGCLIGSMYCFPFSKTGASEYRFHNLGEYILCEEAAGRNKKAPDVILFEINLSAQSHGNLLGVNYLKLGEIHYDLFSDLEYLLSSRELFELKRIIEKNIVQSLPFFRLCYEAWLGQTPVMSEIFFQTLNETIPRIPVLGYMYFECIAEYLMLYSDSVDAQKWLRYKEIYNTPYKRLTYGLYPEYKKSFRLSDFNPSLKDLYTHISKEKHFLNFNNAHFSEYIVKRMICQVNQFLVSEGGQEKIVANKTWSLERMSEFCKPLIGHMIHRELRSFGRYPDFYFYYDQLKALQAWNYWNHMGVAIPFNGVFPKGEVGINPANPELAFRSFRCKIKSKDGFLFAEPAEELQIRLVPRLVDLKYTLMRNKPA